MGVTTLSIQILSRIKTSKTGTGCATTTPAATCRQYGNTTGDNDMSWHTIRVDFTAACENLRFCDVELLEEHIVQFAVQMERGGQGDDLAMAWDAGWSIKDTPRGRMLVIEGGAGAGGYGTCIVTVPLTNNMPYWLEIDVEEEDREWVENFFAYRRYRVCVHSAA
jgi:hypothetical protein